MFGRATIEESDEDKPDLILDYDKEGNVVGLHGCTFNASHPAAVDGHELSSEHACR